MRKHLRHAAWSAAMAVSLWLPLPVFLALLTYVVLDGVQITTVTYEKEF